MSATLPLLAVLLAAAAAWDLRTRRIPNELVFGGLLFGLAVGVATGGLPGLGHAALGAAVGLGALLIPWSRGWLGGGDVKLLCACGAFLGWKGVLVLLLASTALHGFLTLGVLIAAKVRDQEAHGSPYAPALAIAVLVLAVAQPALLTNP